MDNCEYRCASGWLPLRGEEDAILVTREMAIDAGDRELEGQVYERLLIPSLWTRCLCSESDLLPVGTVGENYSY